MKFADQVMEPPAVYNPHYGWSDQPQSQHGSAYLGGNTLAIWSQGLPYVKAGQWLCTFWWRGRAFGFLAVIDDFGDLVPVKEY